MKQSLTTDEKIIQLMKLLGSCTYYVTDLLGKDSDSFLLLDKAVLKMIDETASLSIDEKLEKENE